MRRLAYTQWLTTHRCLRLLTISAISLIFGCSGGTRPPGFSNAEPAGSAELTATDVQSVVQAAAAATDAAVVIAVTDRRGDILAVYQKPGFPATSIGNFSAVVDTNELAVALARTASYFSNDQAPLSSRTVRFISGIHFPPGVTNAANADLYGIENTNRGCSFNTAYLPGQAINPSRSINGATNGLGIITGKKDLFDSDPFAVNPGGVPLFKNGHLVGGVGVAGASAEITEYSAFIASVQAGLGAAPAAPGVVIIGGIALPFVNQTTLPAGSNAGAANGAFVVGPNASLGPVPEGDLIAEAGGTAGLTLADVQQIVNQAIATANIERAVIRLPIGQRAKFAIAVADLNGNLLALYRMHDATVFSIDVAVAKSRNVLYFSSKTVNPNDLPGVPPGTAVSNRTISFGAMPFYPPGIDGTQPGPFFNLYQFDTANPCTNGTQPANPYQNGIVFFPGSTPLYKNGVMVGSLGISGDGVAQDDFDTAQAAAPFLPDPSIRADQIIIRNVRLPYFKFPRDPTF